jgi:hypothetical protein
MAELAETCNAVTNFNVNIVAWWTISKAENSVEFRPFLEAKALKQALGR